MAATALSVNVNKVAVLRNSRGGRLPDPLQAADHCLRCGAQGITVHPRPDRRHITAEDVLALRTLCRERGELNIEGNPFAAPRTGYPGLLELVRQALPEQITLVPDADGQVTSDHGFDLDRDAERLAPLIAEFRALGCRVSLFVDAGCKHLARVREIGAQRIEIYTGPYAEAHARGHAADALARCAATARSARALGIGVNAGHDLAQENLGDFLRALPAVQEVSIGHALFAEALYEGLERTLQNYLALIAAA
jgi:pyridoxine 5-phosphate synthase